MFGFKVCGMRGPLAPTNLFIDYLVKQLEAQIRISNPINARAGIRTRVVWLETKNSTTELPTRERSRQDLNLRLLP